jgi:hypothetical protein
MKREDRGKATIHRDKQALGQPDWTGNNVERFLIMDSCDLAIDHTDPRKIKTSLLIPERLRQRRVAQKAVHPYAILDSDAANSTLGGEDMNLMTGCGKAGRKISRKSTDTTDYARRVLMRNKANAQRLIPNRANLVSVTGQARSPSANE